MTVLAEAYDVALLDLDGVIYVGEDAVPHAAAALADCRARGMRLAFVTNNASRPPGAVAEQLTAMGVAAAATEVVTSAQAAARLLAEMLPAGSRVLVVGGAGLADALAEQGLIGVTEFSAEPAAVVQGFHPDLDWRRLAEGSYAITAGLPWVASNADLTLPTPQGRAPGNGAFIELLKLTTGRTPVVAGKPEPPMHREAVLRSGARRPLVVGDRLDTDIEGAQRAGVDSLLVLTGVTDPEAAVHAPPRHRPTYLAEDLRALLVEPDAVAVATGRSSLPSCVATVVDGRVELLPQGGAEPSRLDVLRAVCGAVWAADEPLDGIRDALAKGGW